MAKENIVVRVSCTVDASIDDLKSIAEDIGELVDMIPTYQQYQAEEITDRIQNHLKKLIKLKHRKY